MDDFDPLSPSDPEGITSSLQAGTGDVPDPALINIADQHGIDVALKIADADPSTPISNFIPASQIKSMGGDPNGTVGDYLQHHQDLIADAKQDPNTNQLPEDTPNAPVTGAPSSVAANVPVPTPPPSGTNQGSYNGKPYVSAAPGGPQSANGYVGPGASSAPVVGPNPPGYRDNGGTGIGGSMGPGPGTKMASDGLPAPVPPADIPNVSNPSAIPGMTADQYNGYKGTVRQIESNGNDNAVSSTGAAGRYQFTKGTWDQYGSGSRMNPDNQEAAFQNLSADNFKGLSTALGRAPTPQELYLAHQQGLSGATKLLTNPTMTPNQLGLGNAVKVNRGDPNAPASDFIGKVSSFYNNGAGKIGAVGQAVATGQGSENDATDDSGAVDSTAKKTGGQGTNSTTSDNSDNSDTEDAATPATPGAKITQGLSNLPGVGGLIKNFDANKFGDALLGIGSALMARDNPAGAAALRGLITSKDKDEDSKQHVLGINGNQVVFTDNKGNVTAKPLPTGMDTVNKVGVNKGTLANGGTLTDLTKSPPTPQELAQAQSIANYQMPFPTGYSNRSPEAIRLRGIIATQYPDYDSKQYNTANAALKDASTGKMATATNALQTVTGHLDDLSAATDALNNGNIQVLNAVANKYGLATGATPQATFNTIKQGLAEEMMKTYRGGGVGSLTEVENFGNLLNPNASPQQIKASIGTLSEMLNSKVQANQDQYQRGVGPRISQRQPLFSKETLGTLDRLQDTGQDAEDAPPSAPALTPSAPAAPRAIAPGSRLRYNPSTGQLEPIQ